MLPASSVIVLLLSRHVFNVDVSTPFDAIADHQTTHENSIVSSDAKLGEDELVVWIPAAQSTDDEGIEVDV